MAEWQLQEAKNRLSQVVERAGVDGPQTITVRGRPKAVVLSFEDYEQLRGRDTTLSEFFAQSPLRVDLNVERDRDPGRDVEL